MNGLWSLVLEFGPKKQGAVIVINDGVLQGGDSGLVYQGEISKTGHIFSGRVTATQYLALADAFFPGVKQFDIAIGGNIDDSTLSGTATTSVAPTVPIKLTGRKHSGGQ